jgi:hypothetical protein
MARQRCAQHVWREHVLDAEDQAARRSRPLSERWMTDHQIAGGQRQRALVNNGADTRQYVVTRNGQPAADHYAGWITEVNQVGDHLTDAAARLADDTHGDAGRHRWHRQAQIVMDSKGPSTMQTGRCRTNTVLPWPG